MNPTKIHPTLLEELNLTARSLHEERLTVTEREFPIIVRMQAARSLDAFSAMAGEGASMRVERRISMLGAVAGTATRAEIDALSSSETVEMIWYDEPVYALLDSSVPLIQVPSIWQMGNQGGGVRVCVIDTGVDPNHPDFAGRLIASQDFTGEGPGDGHGHGTHVASILAGSGAASGGQYRGVAPKASLLSAKVLRGDGTGRMSFVMAGIEWAVDQGAHILNLSLGTRGGGDGSDATSVTCDAAVDAGVIVIAAAGNDGPGSRTIGSPGCARKVITVGACSDDRHIADFSSRGPTLDNRVKPDIVLPGVGIIAARAVRTTLGQPVNELYTSVNGTSMAAPHAAGICALMLAIHPDLRPDEAKRILMEAALSLGVDENMQGKGLVLATRALELTRAAIPMPEPSPTPSPTPSPAPGRPVPTPEPAGCLHKIMSFFKGS